MPELNDFLQYIRPLSSQTIQGLSLLLAAAILVLSDWRLTVAAFAGLHVLAGALLLETNIPREWGLLQWIVGALVGVMWFLSARRIETIQRRQQGTPWWRPQWRVNASTLQRLAVVLLLVVVIYVIRPVLPFPNLDLQHARFATILALAGLLGLGLGDRPLRWGLCLGLWVLATSFALQHLRVDVGTVGLLAGLEILIGFAISYLIVVDGARFWPKSEGM